MIRILWMMLVSLMAFAAHASPEVEKLLATPQAHPYLYFTRQDIPKLRAWAQQEPTQDAAALIINSADLCLQAKLPPEPPPGPDSPFDAQGKYTAEYLKIHYEYYDDGYMINQIVPTLAMAHLLTGERKYADRGKQWLLHYAVWKQWSVKTALADNQSAHAYLGLAIGYDWLYEELTPQERATVRDALRRLGEVFHKERGTGLAAQPLAGRRGGIANNHTWVSHAAPAVGALAQLYEEPPAKDWLETELICWRDKILPSSLGRDGEYVDGPAWFNYCLEYGSLVWAAWQRNGIDVYTGSRLNRVADYMLRAGNLFAEGAALPPYHIRQALLALAAQYRDPTAQWAALANGLRSGAAKSRRWPGMPAPTKPYQYEANTWNRYRLEWDAATGHFRTLIDGEPMEDLPLVEGTFAGVDKFSFTGHQRTVGTFEVRNLKAWDLAANRVVLDMGTLPPGPRQEGVLRAEDKVLHIEDKEPAQYPQVAFDLPSLKHGAIEFEARKLDNNASYFYLHTFAGDHELRGLIWYNDRSVRKHMPDYRNQDWPFGWMPNEGLWYPAVFEFLFCDPSLPAVRPESPAPSWVFGDLGEVHLRTSWQGDAISILFRSGPEIGKDHGDNNAFQLQAFGEDILGDLPTPSSGEKELTQKWYDLLGWFQGTRAHNTVLPGDHTQPAVWGDQTGRRYGEGWLAAPEEHVTQRGKLTDVLLTPPYDFASGQAAPAYTRTEPVLTHFRRDLVFVKPDYVVIHDELAAAKEPLQFRWLLHSRQPVALQDGVMVVTGRKAIVRATPLWPRRPVVDILTTPAPLAKEQSQYFSLHEPAPTPQQRFLVVLQPLSQVNPAAPFVARLVDDAEGFHAQIEVGGFRDQHLFAAESATARGEGWELAGKSAFVRCGADGAPVFFALQSGQRLSWQGAELVTADAPVSVAVQNSAAGWCAWGHADKPTRLRLRASRLAALSLSGQRLEAQYDERGLLVVEVPAGDWTLAPAGP
jgi:hypothetical protein